MKQVILTLVFSRPASPDDSTLREIFVKIARASNSENNGNPESEIFMMVGHGARSNLNDMAQVQELTNAAEYVQQKMNYADAFGVTAREDWPDLMEVAVPDAADQIEESLSLNNANRVVLVPATGSGSGFDAIKEELDNRGIPYVDNRGANSNRIKGICSMGSKECTWNYRLYHKGKANRKHHNTKLELVVR